MILFRLNAGKLNGLGHLSRNLTLAKSLKKLGVLSHFIIKSDNSKFISSFIADHNTNFKFNFIDNSLSLKQELSTIISKYNSLNYKLLILDHYDHNYEYCKTLKNQGIHLCQYDFSAKNKILADIIINPNIGFNNKSYNNISSHDAIICAGSKYLLIKDSLDKIIRKPNSKKNIVIAMGGGNYPRKIIQLITKIVNNKKYNFTVISSDNKLKKLNLSNVKVVFGNIDFNNLYSKTDISIVSGGVTTQELAFLKIPMLIYPYKNNQIINAEKLIDNGFARKLDYSRFDEILDFKINQNKKLVIDDLGSERISKVIYNYIHKL